MSCKGVGKGVVWLRNTFLGVGSFQEGTMVDKTVPVWETGLPLGLKEIGCLGGDVLMFGATRCLLLGFFFLSHLACGILVP